jgi:hypothetical protein
MEPQSAHVTADSDWPEPREAHDGRNQLHDAAGAIQTRGSLDTATAGTSFVVDSSFAMRLELISVTSTAPTKSD